MDMEEITRCWVVSGLVQGVGFRYWTRKEAQRLGLRGFVRNLPDGSVEVQAAGPDQAVAELEQGLHRGPSGAHVSAVASSQPRDTLPTGFDIER